MKRNVIIISSAFLVFVCGWVGACIHLQRQFAQRQIHLQEQSLSEIKQWQVNVKSLRQEIYGSNNFHRRDASPEIRTQLTDFSPSKSAEYITLGYVGGLGSSDLHLSLYGDGTLYSEVRGKRQLISTIPHDRCKSFFHRVLTSGILNYSESVVALKKDLLAPNTRRGVTDLPRTEIHISVPDLNVEQVISVYAPVVELANFPDIVEFQLIVQLEKEILSLVPKDYPLWK